METLSKLDYILKALKISGKETAAALHIDATTVSKWRNGQRKIPYKNGQARQLSVFLLQKEAELGVPVIFNILRALKVQVHPDHLEQQVKALSLWFAEENLDLRRDHNAQLPVFTPKNGYNTNISIFLDEDGIDEAIAYYFVYALRLPPGKTMYLIDYSGIHWTNGDEITEKQIRINACMKFFRAISNYGHKLVIVDCDTDVYRPYRAIFRWMELYLMDGVEVWSHPPLQDGSYHYTNFLLANELALQCISNPDFGGKPHGMLYTNKETVDFFANSVSGILKKSKRLIESVPTKNILPMIAIIKKSLKPNRPLYMLTPALTLQIIDADLLGEILRANGINEALIEECMLINKKIKRLQTATACSYVCNLDILESFVAVEYVTDSNLSEICGTKIILSKEYQRKFIDSIMQSAIYKNNQVIFTSFGYLSAIPDDLSILVQEDGFVAAWNVKKYQKRLYCLNLDVISGFYRYLDDLKTTIPKTCWNRTWRDKQLQRIREAL
ncbi:MAG: helix-turn-helix transcriptional regulator [Peptococcaceae bacterium]|jgi:transcriptional regulator with XRE-family HTH domain|nr:helix-turn-helix transcriptional regulator [Peptococcaceae bacterium]